MPKFSIIIPVYNVEKYIKKCLDSVFNQTFKDYEVIVVNDGTKDSSMDIVKDYDVVVVNQKNQGLSVARNKGVEKARGEYLLFLDSDDSIDKDLLKKINESVDNKPDIVRFNLREIYDDKQIDYEEIEFTGLNGKEAFAKITKFHFVEPAVLYAIKKEYYNNEKFEFKKDSYHEDYGIIPLIIIKAKVVNAISYIGYNYLQRQNSIMSTEDYSKTKKKVEDFYNHYKYLIDKDDDKIYKSFLANSLILKITELKRKDYKKYKKLLKEEKVFDNILADTFVRKIKKVCCKVSPKITKKLLK